MANILPVSDLRNYNEVLKNCHKGEPVYLTKNGRGRFVVMDIEDYERDRAEKKLLLKLQEAEEAVKDGSALYIRVGTRFPHGVPKNQTDRGANRESPDHRVNGYGHTESSTRHPEKSGYA